MRKRHNIHFLDDDYDRLVAEAERQSLNSPTKLSVAMVLHGLIQRLPEAPEPKQPKIKEHVKKKPAKRAQRRSFTMAEAIA